MRVWTEREEKLGVGEEKGWRHCVILREKRA